MAEELDSWEDMENSSSSSSSSSTLPPRRTPLPPPSKLNAHAPSFSFNPSAPSFTPSFSASPLPARPSFVAASPAPATSPAPEPFPPLELVASAPSAAPTRASHFQGTTDTEASETGASIERSSPEENSEDDRVEMDVEKEPVLVREGVAENGPTADQVDKAALSFASMKLTERQSKQAEGQIVDYSEGLGGEHSEGPAECVEEESDKRQHMNVVFIGHVDAGKSTIGGQTLYLSNMVDERTIQKYEREAKEKNRDSWYMAYIMDTNEEERAKGKTVEVGRAHFETEKTKFTILDAPGHKSYVPNMISGASQADVGVLVISARKGEFETGFEKGGQTREHVQLAKTLGVSKLLVAVNKMDEATVLWSKERFDEIEKKLNPFLRSCGYNVKKDVQFLPISGLYGINMKKRIDKSVCPWWSGPCLFEALDAVELPLRDPKGPFRMPLIDKFRDMGIVVMGKIQSGTVRRGDSLIVMPNKAHVKVITLYRDADEVHLAKPGENLTIRLSGIEEDDISPGFVLSSIYRPIPAVMEFDAQLQILELLDHKAIFTAGYKAIIHIHSVVEECEIIELLQQIDPKTKKPMKKKVLFVKSGAVVVVRILVSDVICVERFEDFPQLGRFTLRDEGKTVAIGKVVDLPKVSHQE